jgi:diguanylate cyclase (GGDEF)-like protein
MFIPPQSDRLLDHMPTRRTREPKSDALEVQSSINIFIPPGVAASGCQLCSLGSETPPYLANESRYHLHLAGCSPGDAEVVAMAVKCPTCGETTRIPRCSSCGAELPTTALDQMRDHTASDRDQGTSDRDQTASDQDQTWSDHDQTASERDQRSADDDQHASDDDFAAGGDAITHRRSALARERSGRDRDAVSVERAESAAARLGTAADRDRAAELRDRGAEGRDALARLHDLQDDADASREDILLRAERDRARAAADRAKAADDRVRAASDREEAAHERAEALRNRIESADNLKLATMDELTGALTRKFGLEEVSRELERAHRTGATFVLAFADVDGLKAVNDSQGHLAGDALLRLLGETLRANVRPYDVIVRYGGDELLCAMPNLSAIEARARFQKIAATLAAVDADHSITFGLAEAEPADSLQELIARADADFLQVRHSGTSHDFATEP